MRQELIIAPRVSKNRDRKLLNFGQKWSHQTCQSCGEVFPIKHSHVYSMAKAAYKCGTKTALLCLPCFKKSKGEIVKAKISMAKIDELEKAIALLEKSGRMKAAEILKKQLVEARRG